MYVLRYGTVNVIILDFSKRILPVNLMAAACLRQVGTGATEDWEAVECLIAPI